MMDYTVFYRLFTGFLLGHTVFFWVLMSIFWVLQVFTGLYWILPCFIMFYWVFTRFNWVPLFEVLVFD